MMAEAAAGAVETTAEAMAGAAIAVADAPVTIAAGSDGV